MTEVQFRSYQHQDAPVLPDLFIRAIQEVYPDLEDGDWISGLHDIEKAYLNTGGDFVVGEVDSRIIAMGGIKRVSENVGEIVRVAVEPDMQGIGIGQRLITAMEARAQELGMTTLKLDTTVGQVAARLLYDRNGYRLVDRKLVNHPTGKQFDTFFYEKDLSVSAEFNWIDPDILASEDFEASDSNPEQELEFKTFFETEWSDPKYDNLRERWDPLIASDIPKRRLMAKIALWSLVQVLNIKYKN